VPEEDKTKLEQVTEKFLPYLQELQKKLLIVAISMLISGTLGFIYYHEILDFILSLFNFKGITMVLTSPYQFFNLAINTGLATGLTSAIPLIIYFLLNFLKPALKKEEYKQILNLVPFAIILFLAGFAFGVYIMQFVISIFAQTAQSFNIGNIWDISHFFSQTIIMGVCLGIIFELPILVTILIKLKILKKSTIAANRKYIYAVLIIIVAFLPPNDIFSLSILTITPLFLFEVALLLNQ